VRPVCASKSFDDHAFPFLRAATGKLRHQRVAITVNYEARQAVGFTVDQPPAVALDIKQLAGLQRLGDAR
jgi:hypothetical protein